MQVPSSELSQNPGSGSSVFVKASELVTPGNHKESSTVPTSANHLKSFVFVPASKLLNSNSSISNVHASSKDSSVFVPTSKLLSSDPAVSRSISACSSKSSSVFVPTSKVLSNDSTIHTGACSSKNKSVFVAASKLLSSGLQTGSGTANSLSSSRLPLSKAPLQPHSGGEIALEKNGMQEKSAVVDDKEKGSNCPGVVGDDALQSAVVNDKHFGIDKRTKVTLGTTLSSQCMQVSHCSEQKDGFHGPEPKKGASGSSCSHGCPVTSELPQQDTKSVIDGHKPLRSEAVVPLSESRQPSKDRLCVSVPPGRDMRSSRGPQNRKVKEFAKPTARITNFFEK